MSDAYLYAIAAIAGSVIGALATLVASWVSQRSQQKAERMSRAVSKRQELYEEFIDEASKLYADGMIHELGDPSKLVRLYAVLNKLRLSAPARMLAKAEEIMPRILQLYQAPAPKKHFDLSQAIQRHDDLDLLRAFSDACRDDLHHGARGAHRGAAHAPMAADATLAGEPGPARIRDI